MISISTRLIQRAWLAAFLFCICSTSYAFTAGKDGAAAIAAANQVVNLYTTAPSGGTAGSSTISVASAAGFSAGDMVLVYQAQGASINAANSYAYGSITSYNSAGRYEFQSVQSVAGGTLTFNCGLKYSYAAGRTQVIRVPLYSTLTVNGGASIVAQAWNGSTGGVAAVHVQGTATVNGSIHANGLGFRGGASRNNSGTVDQSNAIFVTTNANLGAEKGEGIAGSQTDYDSLGGRVGRGAPANGGGGGNLHNAGGGGGANGNNGNGWLTSGGSVGGQGVMCPGCTGSSAWTLDPGYAANGNSRTNSAGGGRGGYTYASANSNALTVAPGNSSWGGDYRREVGGLGGRPLDNDPGNLTTPRLFMGGGGGAGDQNNSGGGSGGNGGGIVFVLAGTLDGSGTIQANGSAGANTVPGHNDAPGGGGAGGSIVVVAPSAGGLAFSASGGAGGNQLITGNESEGPGGGGGGGFIASPATGTINGGANGTSTSGAVTEFPTNGATSGGGGQSLGALASYPQCVVPTFPLGGRVYEDTNYGGGAGRSQAASSGIAVENARVELFNSSGAFVTSTLTNASGDYSFAGLLSGNYTVRVVNSSVRSTRTGGAGCAACLPVQTWRTDASSGTAVAVTDRVGGENPQLADAGNGSTTLAALTTASTTPQSITSVTLSAASISGLNFGYNFDTIVNTNDTGQGSLRQFIANANSLGGDGSLAQAGFRADLVNGGTVALASGVEQSIFMIPDGNAHPGLRAGLTNQLTGGRALLGITSVLPAIISSMAIEGGTQTYNVGNTNTPTLGTGGTVGVGALALPQLNGPEVELRDGPAGAAGIAIGLDVQAASVTIRGLAIVGFGSTAANNNNGNIRIGNFTGTVVNQNVLGATALSFDDPTGTVRGTGDNIRVNNGDSGTLSQNLIGFSNGNGIGFDTGNDTNGWTIEYNEIRGNAIASSNRNGIELDQNAPGTPNTIRYNLIAANLGAGVHLASNNADNNTLTQNTLSGNGGANEPGGIRVSSGDNNTISLNVMDGNTGPGIHFQTGSNGNTVSQNRISSNAQSGIEVASGATTNTLSQNVIFGNTRIGIDLLAGAAPVAPYYTQNDNGDGDTGGNNLLNFPQITGATVSGGNLILTGIAPAGAAIEFFVSDSDPTGFGEGQTYLVTLIEGSGSDSAGGTSANTVTCGVGAVSVTMNNFSFSIALPGGVTGGTSITSTATAGGNTSEFSCNAAVFMPLPALTFLKTVAVTSDPINGGSNPKFIPGAEVLYTLNVTNSGTGNVDNNTLTIVDPIPANTELFVGDLGGGLPFVFTDSSSGLACVAGCMDVSTDGGTNWIPVPGGPYAPAVTHLRFRPPGSMSGDASAGPPSPSFSLQFRVRVK